MKFEEILGAKDYEVNYLLAFTKTKLGRPVPILRCKNCNKFLSQNIVSRALDKAECPHCSIRLFPNGFF